MDFYRAQDDARRKTGRLVLLFLGAVLTLVVLTNVLVGMAYLLMTNTSAVAGYGLIDSLAQVPMQTWAMVTLGVIGIIALACGFKFLELRGGGRAVAEALGGRPLTQTTATGKEQRLLNVVEEMALASGIPVPPVYLVPEPSINAFAAGYGTGDAVLGINQGTVDQLSRDELQGVVAHEFSHLLNGDTRINLRLIALLHGILFIGLIGRLLLRGNAGGRSRSSSGGAPLLAFGMGLLVIGYGGTFFGNLIKAAVSRQREYLADGSAVQFTRNPAGIAGALKKIGGSATGSLMSHPRAAQASHMLFGEGMTHFLGSMMATHPPLPERIRAIEPDWDGKFVIPELLPDPMGAETAAADRPDRGELADALEITGASSGFADASFDVIEQRVSAAPELVGNPNDASHSAAVAVLDTTGPALLRAAHEPLGARALCYALLLAEDPEVRSRQRQRLSRAEPPSLVTEAETLRALAAATDDLHRLSLVQAAMPALKNASRAQYQLFLRSVSELIKADARIGLFEWVMHRVLIKELSPHFERPRSPRWRHEQLEQVKAPCLTLMSALARHGNQLPAAQQAAFQTGMDILGFSGDFDAQADPNFVRLSTAVNALRRVRPLAKPRIIKACAATVLADELVSVAEGALLQGVAATLDCPLPPAIYQHLQSRGHTAADDRVR